MDLQAYFESNSPDIPLNDGILKMSFQYFVTKFHLRSPVNAINTLYLTDSSASKVADIHQLIQIYEYAANPNIAFELLNFKTKVRCIESLAKLDALVNRFSEVKEFEIDDLDLSPEFKKLVPANAKMDFIHLHYGHDTFTLSICHQVLASLYRYISTREFSYCLKGSEAYYNYFIFSQMLSFQLLRRSLLKESSDQFIEILVPRRVAKEVWPDMVHSKTKKNLDSKLVGVMQLLKAESTCVTVPNCA